MARPALYKTLVEKILGEFPVHTSHLNAAVGRLSEPEKEALDAYIIYCETRGVSVEYLAESYLILLTDTMQEQIYFRKHGKYRYSTFQEVANDVYFNENYMSHYMYAVALTQFFWPNHLAMFRFFEETLPAAQPGTYLEIGPGHGRFFMHAMRASSYTRFEGVDISETSIKQTRDLLEHCLADIEKKDYTLTRADFLGADLPENHYDAVVMGEVLEHVEQPALFMRQLCRVAKPTAYIFVTTCIDSPVKDHIYLFEKPREITELFESCGLATVEERLLPYEGRTLEESFAERLPVSTAYVLAKKG